MTDFAGQTGSEVIGNINGTRQDVPQGWDLMYESSGDSTATDTNYNGYDSYRGRVGGTDSAAPLDTSSFNEDPLFTNAAGDDFTLQAGSPALSIVASEAAIYATFESTYGLDIRFDINGNAVPATNADAGAYQRV